MNLSIPVGYYNSVTTAAAGITKPDVSDMLEMWAHEETPFLNKISWGAESEGVAIEWLTEHLGFGYIETSAALATGGTVILIASGAVGGLSRAEQAKQIHPGTLLFAKGADGTESSDHAWMVVSTVGASYSITVAFMASCTASIAASAKIYIIGSFANEGSEPDRDVSRTRTILSNNFTILRKDIQITGSQAATGMYAVPNEVAHQTKNRLLEMQREREMSILFSRYVARSSTVASTFKGIAELFIDSVADTTIVDKTTTSLNETTFNNMVANAWDAGGKPDCVIASLSQIRKFTNWAADRIRTTADTRLGGQYISQYLTDSNVTLDLIPMRKFPSNWMFVLDTKKIKLRAKKGRKLLLEKLAKTGDFERWQLLSEYSLEHHGFSFGQHVAFMELT